MAINTSRLKNDELAILNAAQSMGITNPVELAQLLGQLKHESNLKLVDEELKYSANFLFEKFPYTQRRTWGFKSAAEAEPLCCGKNRVGLANRIYGTRLGNNQPGDGFKYRGRGYIQLTGKANYAEVGRKLGIDLVNNPDLVLQPQYAAKVAIQIFWKDKVRPRVSNFADTTSVTKAINGGDIGLADRKAKFKYYSDIFGTTSTEDEPPPSTTPTPKPTNAPAPVPRPPVTQPTPQPRPPVTQPTPQPRPPVTQPTLGPSPQQPLQRYTEYIEKNYINPFKQGSVEVQREILYTQTNASEYFRSYIGNLRGIDYSKSGSIDYLVALDRPDIEADLFLIDSLVKKQEKQKEETKTILDNTLSAFSPNAKYMLIASSLFEMYPDDMRRKMSENSSAGGANPNYSHAWRTPGKVSVTADFTIPGIAGLRIGQIFWIDKISDAYKEYGAFQLFGLTENIDIGKGWTTSIHSRFNVLPRNKGGNYLIDSVTADQAIQAATGISSVF